LSTASRTAAQLRAAFDRSFAEAAHGQTEASDDFLAIRLGGEAHAVRLAEVAHLLPLTALTRLPSPLSVLLGVIGFRGAIVPVYDLRALLGHAAPEPPHWLTITQAEPVAFAFDAFDGHRRRPRSASVPRAHGEPARQHVREVLCNGEQVWPIVSMASVLETVKAMVQPGPERSV
jgi:purine-binding chemotaxis protein CheW